MGTLSNGPYYLYFFHTNHWSLGFTTWFLIVLENTEATGRSIRWCELSPGRNPSASILLLHQLQGSQWLGKDVVSVIRYRKQVDNWPNTDNFGMGCACGIQCSPPLILLGQWLSLLSIKRTPSPWADTMPYKLYYKIMAVIIIIIRMTFGFHGRMKTHVTPLK